MRLKNTAHFIGILRGANIELRDYDSIEDLPDGTKILIFSLNEEQGEKLKDLIDNLEASSYQKYQKGFDKGVSSCEHTRRPKLDFLERIGLRRRALIEKEDRKSDIIFRKGRRIVSKPRLKIRLKVPMLKI